MAATDTRERPETRADAGDAGDPPPRKRRKSLATLDDVAAEMGRVYWAMKHNELALDKGKALVYVLSVMIQAHKAKGDEGDLTALLQQVKERLQ